MAAARAGVGASRGAGAALAGARQPRRAAARACGRPARPLAAAVAVSAPAAAGGDAGESEGTREAGRRAYEPIRMRIDDQWYDARGWAKAHPGGARWIEWFDGRDATSVFYALHSYGPNGSLLAADRLAKLPRCDPPPGYDGDSGRGLPSTREYAQLRSFTALREKLEADGFFERKPLQEAWALAQVIGLYAAGISLAHTHAVASVCLLGLGMQQAGWLAHDYIHGRGRWCESMRWFGALMNGHSCEWWMQKHSLHHCFTNEERLDHDIFMEPFYYMRSPDESGRPDSPMRKYQHIYGYPLISVMYFLWRWLSLKTVFARRDRKEGAVLAAHYALLFALLPLPVAIGSIFLGGFLVGALVSATHQSEEIMLEGDEPDFVEGQFRSTRDADTVFGPIETWLWGGMDTQLEHHLFPTMPRYNYHTVRPILQAWAKENGAGYRISPSTKIIADNFATLKRVAAA
eukprot:PRCOL_00000583-RA